MSSTHRTLAVGLHRRSIAFIALLALAHLAVDVHQGALPALLPTLKDAMGLTYAQATFLYSTLSITSSFVQPALGYVSDNGSYHWLIPGGVVLAGVGATLMGFASGYGGLLACVVLLGSGAAMYHPEAARTANDLSGSRKGTGMSYWVVGGSIGVAVGPLYALAVLATGGLKGTAISLAFCIPIACLFVLNRHGLAEQVSRAQRGRPAQQRSDLPGTNWPGQILLVAAVVVRSAVQAGLVTLLPFYYVQRLGGSTGEMVMLQALLLGSGVVGTLLGGPLADRFGLKSIIVGSFLVVVPLTPLLLFAKGLPALALIFAVGCAQASTSSIATVLGQQYMQRFASVSAGLTIGFANGLGGLAVGILGWAADHWGITLAVQVLVALPALGVLLCVPLPRPPEAAAA